LANLACRPLLRTFKHRMGRRTCPSRRCPTRTLVVVVPRQHTGTAAGGALVSAEMGADGGGRRLRHNGAEGGGAHNGTASGRRGYMVVLEAQGCAGGQGARHAAVLRVAAGQARRVAVAASRAALRPGGVTAGGCRPASPGGEPLSRARIPARRGSWGFRERRAAARMRGGGLRLRCDPRD